MILTAVPFSPDKNLGAAYNEVMRLAPDDGWVCLLDHDMMFTTPYWYSQLERAITTCPDAGAFGAVTNRIASAWQQVHDGFDPGEDVGIHRRIGEARRTRTTLLDVTETAGWGGVVILTSKAAWAKVGGFADGLFCVDHMYHYALRETGLKSYLIEGLYVYHWRGSSRSMDAWKTLPHAKTKDGKVCPCRRMPNPDPTRRIECS